eukprot:scaffold88_cov387-Prasinococcus_capsulatus_cf.AAC.5
MDGKERTDGMEWMAAAGVRTRATPAPNVSGHKPFLRAPIPLPGHRARRPFCGAVYRTTRSGTSSGRTPRGGPSPGVGGRWGAGGSCVRWGLVVVPRVARPPRVRSGARQRARHLLGGEAVAHLSTALAPSRASLCGSAVASAGWRDSGWS